jgi:hypothetical protein
VPQPGAERGQAQLGEQALARGPEQLRIAEPGDIAPEGLDDPLDPDEWGGRTGGWFVGGHDRHHGYTAPRRASTVCPRFLGNNTDRKPDACRKKRRPGAVLPTRASGSSAS